MHLESTKPHSYTQIPIIAIAHKFQGNMASKLTAAIFSMATKWSFSPPKVHSLLHFINNTGDHFFKR